MAEFNRLLLELKACKPARDWAKGKTWEKVYTTCNRGDWLLWLFKKTNPDDIRALTLAKGHCVKTIYHLLEDKRSRAAVDAAISFGEGKISRDELEAAAYAAADAVAIAYSNAAYAAAYAAYAAATTASAAASAASAADAAYAAAYAADASFVVPLKETADICRRYLPIELWNINKR